MMSESIEESYVEVEDGDDVGNGDVSSNIFCSETFSFSDFFKGLLLLMNKLKLLFDVFCPIGTRVVLLWLLLLPLR